MSFRKQILYSGQIQTVLHRIIFQEKTQGRAVMTDAVSHAIMKIYEDVRGV
jgi:hypothetical protein